MRGKSKLLSLLMMLAVMLAYMPAYLADEVYAAASAGQWQTNGSGTQYYAEFPSGYYRSSSLYGKYNNSKLSPYENADSKREVSTTRVSYVYWHWTWNASVSTEQNNKLIDDKQGYDGQHDYQFFTDFESPEEYPVWSGDDRVYEYWRNRPEDGSKWWFRIPVYMQTYTDYKFVSSDSSSDNNSSNSNNNNNSNSSNSNVSDASKKTSESSNAKKYTPKKTSVQKCSPKKKSCSVRWKKCSGKCTGYQVRYCTNKNFKGCKTKKIKGRSNCSCSLTGLKAGTTYYYQIRCYRVVGRKTYCSKWSKCSSFRTKKEQKAKPSAKNYDLPTSIKTTTVYYGEKTNCQGEKVRYAANTVTWNYKYKYDKYGHVVSTYNGYGKITYTWKYKKKKPVYMTFGEQNNSGYDKKTFGKKGRLKNKISYWYDENGVPTVTGRKTYAYNKKGWISKCTQTYSDGSTITTKFRYKFHKNGFPKAITETNNYGSHTVKVNDKGLITNNGSKGYKYKYTYDKKGRAKTCVIKVINDYSGKVVSEERIYFKYGKAKTTDKKAYFAAMNNCVYNTGEYNDDASVN